MSILRDIFNEADAKLTKTLVAQDQVISAKFEAKLHNFIRYAETGSLSYMVREMEKLRGEDNSSKENVEPDKSVVPKRSTRQRNATTLADVTFSAVPHIRIKQEKMSVASLDSVSTNCTMTKNDVLHKEQSEKMPAPSIVPPRKKKIKEEPTEPVLKKPTRTRTKPKKYLEVPQMDGGKPSDVMIQDTRVTLIDITDEKGSRKETDRESASANETMRSTRTKTRQKKKQIEENVDTDTEHKENTDEEPQGKSRQNKKHNEPEDGKSEETHNKSGENRRQNEDREKKVNKGKLSEAIIQNTTVTINNKTKENKSDNEKKIEKPSRKETDDESASANETMRSTRTKTRQKKKQIEENVDTNAERKEDTDEEPQGKSKSRHNKKHNEPEDGKSEETQHKSRPKKRHNEDREKKTTKRSKSSSSSDKGENKSAQTVYEDAVSNCGQNGVPESLIIDATVVEPPLNQTVVLEKGTVVKKEDEHKQLEEKEKNYTTPPPKSKSKKQQIKEIFSPYEKTSMKNKVEAFERFGSASKHTGRSSKIPIIKEESSSDPVKVKSYYTPFSSKFLPKTCSTSKINRLAANSQTSLSNDSGLSMKSLSALKVSQAEYREREKRRQEKEREAQIKKDALLQAQAEEKRRKREEKQLKAQQQREIMQKEKEKLLELHKLKEEKHKLAIAEKEEKLQRAKEEAEKKRQLVKQKAKLVKSSEASHEENKLPESDKTKRTRGPNQIPIYMMTKPPLLPTGDCYDSDDDEYRKNAYVKPDWSRDECMRRQMYVQLAAGEKVKNSLFCCKIQTPDLTDIFEVIDPKKLKRTSSASWKKPPRYTLFSMTSDIVFSEDSDGDINA